MRKRIWMVTAMASATALGQTPPCGVAVLRTGGEKVETRFLAASPEQVKASAVRALPAFGLKLHKKKGMDIEAKTDQALYQSISRQNRDAGVKGKLFSGLGAFGTAKIFLQPETRDGAAGTSMRVEFHKNAMKGRIGSDKYATPLADEIGCLVKVLSPADPVMQPRGIAPAAAKGGQVTIPEGTTVKLLLRDPLSSKTLNDKKKRPQQIVFEAAEDVVVDGVAAIRRGALATAVPGDGKKAGGWGKHGEIQFNLVGITAADGQSIKVLAPGEKVRGGRKDDTATAVLAAGAFGWLAKGSEAIIRAGTMYEAEVDGSFVVKAEK